MPFWKSLLIDLIFISLYFIAYKLLGFELTVIFALGQIFSNMVKKEYPKKVQPPSRNVYVPQKRKIRF